MFRMCVRLRNLFYHLRNVWLSIVILIYFLKDLLWFYRLLQNSYKVPYTVTLSLFDHLLFPTLQLASDQNNVFLYQWYKTDNADLLFFNSVDCSENLMIPYHLSGKNKNKTKTPCTTKQEISLSDPPSNLRPEAIWYLDFLSSIRKSAYEFENCLDEAL